MEQKQNLVKLLKEMYPESERIKVVFTASNEFVPEYLTIETSENLGAQNG